MGLLPSIQHTMPPIQPTIVLTTQAPTLGVLPSMGINFSVAGDAGDGGGAGNDRAQHADDNIPEDHDAGPDKDPEGDDSGDCDVIVLGSPAHRVVRCSVTTLSTGGCDAGIGSTSGSMAADLSRISGGSKASSPHLFGLDRLKLTSSMPTAAAQMLIWSTHKLLDCPKKSLQKTTDLSDDEDTLGRSASFDNVTTPQEDEAEEGDVDSLADSGDLATEAHGEKLIWLKSGLVSGPRMQET